MTTVCHLVVHAWKLIAQTWLLLTGERLVGELAPELLPMLATLEMPADFVPMTNTILAEMQRRGIGRDQILTELQKMGQEFPSASLQLLQVAPRPACIMHGMPL